MDGFAYTCPMRVFDTLPDPRATNVRHRLIDLLAIALMGMICDADGWEDLEDFARSKASWFATFMDLPHGVPSADTFRRVISRLDPQAFEQCFVQWTKAVSAQSGGRVLAIDGKSIRRSFEQGWDKSGMAHMVSVFAADNAAGGQTLCQLKTAGKGGELDAIAQLLGLVELKGATVTIDAIGCQKSIAQQIIDRGGDYLLAVKENQPTLHQRIQVEMDDLIRRRFQGTWHDRHEATDAGHGRIETRRGWATDQLGWLKIADAWPGLKTVVCVEAQRLVIGQGQSVERRYFISSLAADAEALGQTIRDHWGIENRLHHVLDVSFHEDACRVRRGHGPENLSRLRRLALNLLRSADAHTKRQSIKGRRKIAGWNHQFLLNLIAG
jgi:predicted transposase YbfD/YdcC